MGRYVFGIASLCVGVASFFLDAHTAFFIVTGIAQTIGGAALLFRNLVRPAAAILGIVSFVDALTTVPVIVAHAAVFAAWGNAFYPLASVAGAAIAFVLASRDGENSAGALGKGALVLFGLCNISFGIEQLEYFRRTAGLVPQWIVPNGDFWTWLTTVAFWLAGISLITGYKARLASRLLTVMFAIFTVVVWIPILIVDPKTHSNWSEGLGTFAIAGAAWIVADFHYARPKRSP